MLLYNRTVTLWTDSAVGVFYRSGWPEVKGNKQVGIVRLKHIGKMLETARKMRGLTADTVAERCNVTRGRVYQWEKQKFVLPKNFPLLSAALGIPLDLLVAENGRRPASKKIPLSKIEQRLKTAA